MDGPEPSRPPPRAGSTSTTGIGRHAEVHRLAVAGGETRIARDTGDRLGRVLLPWSRFAEVEAIATATLTLGPHASAFYDRGWAYSSTGRPRPALDDYQQALSLDRQAGDRGNEAATLEVPYDDYWYLVVDSNPSSIKVWVSQVFDD